MRVIIMLEKQIRTGALDRQLDLIAALINDRKYLLRVEQERARLEAQGQLTIEET